MRLINVKTMKLEKFFEAARIPPYAILSHTWGDEEVSLQRFQHESLRRRRKGFGKIQSACQKARFQGLDYLWVDTCCIDKTSSAELSEAINSMFKWYQRSEICYAFCDDVEHDSISPSSMEGIWTDSETGFAASRWFTRGWTLQELIAPKEVFFYNKKGLRIGEKRTSSKLIKKITGIDTFILEGGPLEEVSVGRRMSWAVDRQTTREEDLAYSLMGLFGINMPLLYGEGPKAFIRLQEEILRQSDDHTLFAWRSAPESAIHGTASGLLADHPRNFRNFRSKTGAKPADADEAHIDHKDHIVRVWDHKVPQSPITLTNKGIHITSRVADLNSPGNPEQHLILILNCSPGGDMERAIGIYIQRQYEDRYARVRTDELADVHLSHSFSHATHTLHGLKAGGADIFGHKFDQPWTTSVDIQRDIGSLEWQKLKGHQPDSGTALLRRYQNAFQLHRTSFKLTNFFGSYFLCGVGIWQEYGAWRFFRFDPNSRSGDLIFDTTPGCKFALLYRMPNRMDHLIVVLGVDPETGKHWINAMCMDDMELTRDGANVAKILTDAQALSDSQRSHTTRKLVRLVGGSLYTAVHIKPRLVGGIPMQRVHLTRPWPSSWKPFFRRWLNVITGYIVYLLGIYVVVVVFIYVV